MPITAAQRRWLLLVPNTLTGLRLGLTIAFPFVDARWWPIVIVLAAASDFIDGFIARRFDLTSWIGGLLDAAADKAFTLTVLLTYTLTGALLWWQLALLLLRDITVLLIAAYAALLREWGAFQRMASRLPGKITTALLFVLLLVIAMWPDERAAILITLYAASFWSLVAAVDYFVQFLHTWRWWMANKTHETAGRSRAAADDAPAHPAD